MTFFFTLKKRIRKHILSLSLLIAAIEGVIATLFIILYPSGVGQRLIFGLSLQRLFLVLLNTLFFSLFLFSALYLWKHADLEEDFISCLRQWKKTPTLLTSSIIIGFIFIGFAFLTPEYRFGSYIGYFERLYPSIAWLTLISLQVIFLLLSISVQKVPKIRYLKGSAYFFFITLMLTWAFVAWTGFGIHPDDRYWNEAGVPLLNEQIFIAILISIFFFILSDKSIKNIQTAPILAFIYKKKDTLIFIALWAVTAIIWINEPLPRNFFAPGPYPPNQEFSPFADTAAFDIGGQFSLIGQGLFNSGFYARALLSGFLALLHHIGGQNYLTIVSLQTTIYASFVPILYLIGKELHSRTAGILLSVLFIFKNVNAIASSTWILSVHSKYMLTEFPTGIMLALFTLWLIRWKKTDGRKDLFLILSGGALGLGIMLRTNILFFLPLAIFIFLLKFKTNRKKILRSTIILLLAFFITISPWMWRNQKVANKPFFFLDIITEVLRSRYSQESAEENLLLYPQPQERNSQRDILPERSSVRTLEVAKVVGNSGSHQEYNPPISPLVFIPNHFFHNLVTSVLILPTSPTLHDLQRTIKDIYPYWNKLGDQGWTGQLTIGATIGLLWNLFLLALGLNAAWKRWHIAALLPLLVFLTYHLSNAFARTSGGRYLIPVDWVILLYYALGIIEILFFISSLLGFKIEPKEKIISYKNSSFSYQKEIFYILPFFFFVGSITMLDQLPAPRYPALTSEQIQEQIIQGEYLKESSISEKELDIFLQNTKARIYLGRALYPRFYPIGGGEHSQGSDAFENKDFPRLTFTMIGTFGKTGVVLPLDESPSYFPNVTDIILIGCQHPTKEYLFPYIDAIAVILFDEDHEVIYMREPETQLQCPLPDPICDGNRNCR